MPSSCLYKIAHLATKRLAEAAQSAGEHNDLLMLPGPAQRIEHPLNAVVVTVHKRVVEDDRRGSSAFGEHGTHGEAQPRVSYAAQL